MTDLPAPLVPAEIDLRDFAFMPLDAARLRDAKIVDAVSGDEFRAAVLLWCSSWHQVPAGSLPDDDVQLAKFAGYGRVLKEWKKVRDGALYGFVKCSDGRFYHPTICEKALGSWAQKQEHAARRDAERLRKAEFRRKKSEGGPVETGTLSHGTDPGSPAENALKGQGEGQGEGQPSLPPGPDGPRTGGPAGLSDDFISKLCLAAGSEPCRTDNDLGPIEALISDGCTEADVLEGVRIAVGKTSDRIRRWTAFGGWVRNVRDDRLAGPRKAKPNGRDPTYRGSTPPPMGDEAIKAMVAGIRAQKAGAA